MTTANAWAFTLETAFSTGCHEQITLEALSRSGWPAEQTEPPADAADLELANNLPFSVPPLAGRWTLSLLLGVRSNDLHGYAPTDFQEFAAVQLGEEAQEEHCLRAAADDNVEGDIHATKRCQQFIQARAKEALGSSTEVNLNDTESVRVALRFQNVNVEVSRFAYRAGQALHALQDSYTHTLREPTTDAIVHVFNYVDPAIRGDYSPLRDGFGHVSKFDDCSRSDPHERDRTERATAASAALLSTMVTSNRSIDQKLASAEHTLRALVNYQAGCSPDNAWCDAASAEAPFQSCSSAGSSPSLWLLAIAGLRFATRRKRAQSVAAAGLAFSLTSVGSAWATPIIGYAGAAASLDRTALAVNAGLRFDLSERIRLGIDAELNPWFDVVSSSASLGSFNAYGSGSYQWLNTGTVALHTTLKAGVSVLLFNAVGIPAGTTGLFVGASLLGVSLELRPLWWFVIHPIDVAVPIPSLKGVPLVARQYRLSIGIEHRF